MPRDWGSADAVPRAVPGRDVDPAWAGPGERGMPGDPALVGCRGVVTVRIPGGDAPGEVRLYVRGTYELFIAYTGEALNVGHRVEVFASRGNRAVDVTSIFTEP